ncbi:hypothetical protein AgCh_000356 [Apium graveolens]
MRVSDPKEYFAGVCREWAYRREESDQLRDDLIAMGVKVPVRQSLTMRWERCASWKCAYFVWLDEPLTGRALKAVHHIYKEMDRKHYDMKMELWA